MACDIQAILTEGQELQAQLANYSIQDQLAALYILTCSAATVPDCNPAVILAKPEVACIACLSGNQLLTAIASMLCASGIGGQGAPDISSAQLQSAVFGQPYTITILDYTNTTTAWTIVSGTLPPGLSLSSSTGQITGTPTQNQTLPFEFGVRATNASGSSYKLLSIEVIQNCQRPKVTGSSVLACMRNEPFQYQYGGTGAASFTWSISAGALPAGITLNASTGLLSGIPTATGSTFTLKATNACGNGTLDITFGVDPGTA
jgi:Putative Ig domain